MKLYPIILFAYNRPWHTEQVLMALNNNQLAEQSHLIVFVDGPKDSATPEQCLSIEEVRRVVQREQWCGSVEYHIAEKNIGCRNSIVNGISQVLSTYEAAIVLEDDIVTSPYFLRFMNKCLDFYRDYKGVFSISGMTLPAYQLRIPEDYQYDVYVSLRQLNSGWGTWRDRWNLIDWNLNFMNDFLKQTNIIDAYNRGGDDLSRMLIEQVEGKSDAWDIQFTYNQFKYHAVSIIPCRSYVDNIGGDGSGTHHGKSDVSYRFDINEAVADPKLLDVLYEDKRIVNMFYNAFCSVKRPLWQKIINQLSRMLGANNVFNIKKRIYE
jgi:hypothetical protein